MNLGLENKSVEELEKIYKYIEAKKDSEIYVSIDGCIDTLKFQADPVAVLKQIKRTSEKEDVHSKGLIMSESSSSEDISSVRRQEAVVVVVGDVGRSPRMCNHALSLATQLNYNVTIVGYMDSRPGVTIRENPHIRFVRLASPPDALMSIPESLALPIKFFWTFFALCYVLLFQTRLRLHLVLVQNPPALPAIFVCWPIARFKSAKFVIDWHNYTHSMLKDKWKMSKLELPRAVSAAPPKAELDPRRALKPEKQKKEKKGIRGRFIEWTYWYEGFVGARSDGNLCVTKAMRGDLKSAWELNATTFYDRPPSYKFRDFNLEEKHDLFLRLSKADDGGTVFTGKKPVDPHTEYVSYTRFTFESPGKGVQLREDRPLLLISSTSWTPDEDFHVLLDALIKYDKMASMSTCLSDVVCVVTGKGPEKEYYKERISKLRFSHVQIVTPWLEAEDYPLLLAAADVGVSLHYSTSGLDLPMKVVDMFGAGIPVFAKRFYCLHELVSEGHNGRMFDTPHELNMLIQKVAEGGPSKNALLHEMKSNVAGDKISSWETQWKENASEVLEPVVDPHEERILAD